MASNQSRRVFLQQLGIGLGTTVAASALPSFLTAPGKRAGINQKKLGIALVGLGSYAEHQLAVGLEKTSNCYLAGIVTGTLAKAEKWMQK